MTPHARSSDQRDVLLIHIANFYDLLAGYGAALYPLISQEIRERLTQALGPDTAVHQTGPYLFVELAGDHLQQAMQDEQAYCDHMVYTLTRKSFTWNKQHLLLQLTPRLINRDTDTQVLANDRTAPEEKSALWGIAAADPHDERLQIYRDDMEAAAHLLTLLRQNELLLAFQPVVSLPSPSTCLYWESLLRRRSAVPEAKLATCATMVMALEHMNLVHWLDRAVLHTTLSLLTEYGTLNLGCNVSAQSLAPAYWWSKIFERLRAMPRLARRLTIEVTETHAITEPEQAAEHLRTLRELGVKIAIDDMGAGYSTQAFVARTRPDYIKIDKTYVHAPGEAAGLHALQELVRECTQWGGCVVIEGIETPSDLRRAQQAGAHALQGFHIAAPDVRPGWLSSPARVLDNLNY